MLSKTQSVISILELKRILTVIIDNNLSTCIRFRLLGEMWQSNYMRVLKMTESGVLLNDEIKNKLISIRDLSQVMQFELDTQLHAFQPHFHYEVSPYS